MKVKQEILQKAIDILDHKNDLKLCKDAGICPECGNVVIEIKNDLRKAMYVCTNDFKHRLI